MLVPWGCTWVLQGAGAGTGARLCQKVAFFPLPIHIWELKEEKPWETAVQSYPCASEVRFVGQSHVRCYYEPQWANSFLLPNPAAV